ncbi:hypothetical protein BJF79_30900 [Actinomadura sp. CNU-125]|nr:hypothetical protein BJF79_30900 [Actinomadura sp. CNU-125]
MTAVPVNFLEQQDFVRQRLASVLRNEVGHPLPVNLFVLLSAGSAGFALIVFHAIEVVGPRVMKICLDANRSGEVVGVVFEVVVVKVVDGIGAGAAQFGVPAIAPVARLGVDICDLLVGVSYKDATKVSLLVFDDVALIGLQVDAEAEALILRRCIIVIS